MARGVGRSLRTVELGLNVGRYELEDFYFGVAELVAERLCPGVNGGLVAQ